MGRYFHIVVELKTGDSPLVYLADLDEQVLRAKYVRPYLAGESLLLDGEWIVPSDIQKFQIWSSDVGIDYYLDVLKAKEEEANVCFLRILPIEIEAIMEAEEVTDMFMV